MERIEPIYLGISDLDELSKYELGHGTDGGVFRLDKNSLIKLYHMRMKHIENLSVVDDSDMKFFDKSKLEIKKMEEPITYFRYSNEDIRIRSKEAIYEAIRRQEDIKRTHLPKNVVYVNGAFAGCVLKYIRGIQIHKLQSLPLSKRKQIMKEVLLSVKELMDHYIYHVDLSNSPYSKKAFVNNKGETELLGHSHVLVDPFTLKPNIIDLDGKSTIYREHYSEKDERDTMFNVSILLIEFLLRLDTDEYDIDDQYCNLASTLEYMGIEKEFIDNLSTYSLSMNQAFDLVDSISKLKRV